MREALAAIYREWINDFLTIGGFADYYHLTDEDAETIIRLGRKFHEELAENPHDESR